MIGDIQIGNAVDGYLLTGGDYSDGQMHAFFDREFIVLEFRRRRQMISRCKMSALRRRLEIEMSDQEASNSSMSAVVTEPKAP